LFTPSIGGFARQSPESTRITASVSLGKLIEVLKGFPPETEVVVEGYEGGTNPLNLSSIKYKYVDKDAGADWCGWYGDPEDSPEGMANPAIVIFLSRD
jgi:hypothetical protein